MPRYSFANPYGAGSSNPNAAPIAGSINNIAKAFFGDPNDNPEQDARNLASAEHTNLESAALKRKTGAANQFFTTMQSLPPEQRGQMLTKAAIDYADATGDVEQASKMARMWAALSEQDDNIRANASVAAGAQISPNDAFSLKGQQGVVDRNLQNDIIKENSTVKVVPEGGQLIRVTPPAAGAPGAAAPVATAPVQPGAFNAPAAPPGMEVPPEIAAAAPQQMASVTQPAAAAPASSAPSTQILYERPRRATPAPKDVIDDVTGMLRLHDNLETINKNASSFGPVESMARGAMHFMTGTYGDAATNDAYSAQSTVRADIQSVIKGIPSNYDAKIFENTLPGQGDGPDLIASKKKLLDKTVELGLRNTVANYQGTKQELPPAIIQQIESRGIKVDDILRQDNSPAKLQQELDAVGAEAAKLGGRNPEDYVRGKAPGAGAAPAEVAAPQGWDPEDWKYLTPEEKAMISGKQ